MLQALLSLGDRCHSRQDHRPSPSGSGGAKVHTTSYYVPLRHLTGEHRHLSEPHSRPRSAPEPFSILAALATSTTLAKVVFAGHTVTSLNIYGRPPTTLRNDFCVFEKTFRNDFMHGADPLKRVNDESNMLRNVMRDSTLGGTSDGEWRIRNRNFITHVG